MSLDLNAIHADYEAWQKAHQSFDTDEWRFTGDKLAGWVPDLLAALATAEQDRDRLRAEIERAKPVLDAARALRHGRDSCEPGWTWAKYYANLANFDAVVDEHDAAGPGGCAGHTKAVADESSTGGISERTMAAIAAYARATGMVPNDPAAEGLSSTDTTAVD